MTKTHPSPGQMLRVLVATAGLAVQFAVGADSVGGGMRVATDCDRGDSLTGGIQEAIDSLPVDGGAVYVPEGSYVLGRPIKLKPNTKLVGAGRSTVLRKDAAFKVLLAEDAKPRQDHVVVSDASKLRPGAAIAIGDCKHPSVIWGGMFLITKIEGQRVYIDHILSRGGLRSSLSVKDGASLMNLFMVILPAKGSVIQDLNIDGNAAEQMIDEATKHTFTSYGMLWCGIYPCSEIKVERCWIHHAGIGMHLNGSNVEVRNCRISDNLSDGIHTGGCPGAMIANNRIHDNGAAGVSFCFGNRGLIIAGNHIYRNLAGIYALGIGDAKRDMTADRYTIISNNVIFANRRAGICSGQGEIGPQDFIFTGNVVKDNQQDGSRYLGRHQIPAGICLYNAQRCIVTSNRCMDDQDAFPRMLASDAQAGDDSIMTVAGDRGAGTGKTTLWEGQQILITDDQHREIQRVDQVSFSGKAGAFQIKLRDKLAHSFAVQAGARASGTKTQSWGIFVGGPQARDNVIANNVCTGNLVGGILWQGAEVTGNVGDAVAMDKGKPLAENVFAAIGTVALPNPGFEQDGGWRLADTASFASPGHSGKRALRLARTQEKGVVDATTEFFGLKACARYRLSAWVMSNARRGERLVEPYLFLYGKDWKAVGGRTRQDRTFGVQSSTVRASTWFRVSAEAETGPRPVEARIYCRFESGTGVMWFDDIRLEQIHYVGD